MIADSVSDQFGRTLRMLREAILAFPPDEWRKGDIDYLRPAGVAYHAIETIDFYTGEQSVDGFPWGGRFDVDWEDSRSERLPSQDELIEYLDETEDKLGGWLKETDLSSEEKLFPWTGAAKLGRAIYTLRNTQHHLSEMCIELTRRGHTAPEWQ